MSDQAQSIVAKHAAFFAESDGQTLTRSSITAGHSCQGITAGVGIKGRAIMNMMCGKPETVDTICDVVNPAKTGIWDDNGNFDEVEFDKLTSNPIVTSEGERLITKQMFHDHLAKKYDGVEIKPKNACHIFMVVPVPFVKVTGGSIDELFEYYADKVYVDSTTGIKEPAFTVEALREFYTDPVSVMKKRSNDQQNW